LPIFISRILLRIVEGMGRTPGFAIAIQGARHEAFIVKKTPRYRAPERMCRLRRKNSVASMSRPADVRSNAGLASSLSPNKVAFRKGRHAAGDNQVLREVRARETG
jgi:hypothetical protein